MCLILAMTRVCLKSLLPENLPHTFLKHYRWASGKKPHKGIFLSEHRKNNHKGHLQLCGEELSCSRVNVQPSRLAGLLNSDTLVFAISSQLTGRNG